MGPSARVAACCGSTTSCTPSPIWTRPRSGSARRSGWTRPRAGGTSAGGPRTGSCPSATSTWSSWPRWTRRRRLGPGSDAGCSNAPSGGGGWFTIAAVAEDLDAVAARLGLEIGSGSRTRPDGEILRWRSAGLDDPRREPWMPFFLAWDVPEELHPGRARAGHGVRAEGIAWVEDGGRRRAPPRVARRRGAADPGDRGRAGHPAGRRRDLRSGDRDRVGEGLARMREALGSKLRAFSSPARRSTSPCSARPSCRARLPARPRCGSGCRSTPGRR